ncbi:unnamed protein product [Anisakis simplex]|uniref:Serine-rich adhesin for platelets-like n=1 Tax=Anisakis simplex TaxID=6269 RepID=A0A158PNI8_ANISI|nr:unnamed protein product [Anisakis simplex]
MDEQRRPIIVNSLLCFIHNYRERLRSDQLSSFIHSYFSKSAIENAHSTLIDLLPRLENTFMPSSTALAPPSIPSATPTDMIDKAAVSSANTALGTTILDADIVASATPTGTATTPKCQLKATEGAAQASSSATSSSLSSPSSSPKNLPSSESKSVAASENITLCADNDEDADSKHTTSAGNDNNQDVTSAIANNENNHMDEHNILCLYDHILNSRKASLPIFVAEELNSLPLALIMADDHNGDARYELLLAEIRQLKCFIHDALRLNNNYLAHQRSCSNCDMTLSRPTSSRRQQTDAQRTPLSSSCTYTFSSNSATPTSSHHKKRPNLQISSSCSQSVYCTYPHCINDSCNSSDHRHQRQLNDINMSCTSSPESAKFITASNSCHPTITTDPCDFSSPMTSDTSSCSTGSSNTAASPSSCSLTSADTSRRLATVVSIAPVASTSEAVTTASNASAAQLHSSSALSPLLCCCSSSSVYSSTPTSNSSTMCDTSSHRNSTLSTTSSSFSSYCTSPSHNHYHQHHHHPHDHHFEHAHRTPAGGLRDVLLSNVPRALHQTNSTEDNNVINGLITNNRATTVNTHCNNKHHLHLSCTDNNNATNNDSIGISNGGDDSDHEHNSSSSSSGSSTANETVTDQQTEVNNATTATNFLSSSSSFSDNTTNNSNDNNNNNCTDSSSNDDGVKNHLCLQQKKRCLIGGLSGAVNGGSRLDATVRKLRRLADKHQTQIASAPIKTTCDDRLSSQNYAVTNNVSDNDNRSSPTTLSAPPSVAAASSSTAAATTTKLPSSSSSSSLAKVSHRTASPTFINNHNRSGTNSQASITSNSNVWPAQIVDPIAYINMLRTMTMSAMSSVVVNNNNHPQTSIFPQTQAQAAQAAAITSAAAAAKSILLATDHHHNSSVVWMSM